VEAHGVPGRINDPGPLFLRLVVIPVTLLAAATGFVMLVPPILGIDRRLSAYAGVALFIAFWVIWLPVVGVVAWRAGHPRKSEKP
jgi:hypothetical protein